MTEQTNKPKQDFAVSKFYYYSGANYYIDKEALVFNLSIDPDGAAVDFYKDRVLEKFPQLTENLSSRVVYLFGDVLSAITQMNMNLFTKKYEVSRDGEDWVVALESLDEYLAIDIVSFVSDWFNAMNNNDTNFDFDTKFEDLQETFNKTIYGGPTIYSLVEGGLKRGVSVKYMYEENQFQWGYGKKQQRGRSTIFHTDGIKDTEFTSYKDMVGEFLELCGFPTPKGKNCFTEKEIIAEAEVLGFPVVVKPVAGHKGQGVTTGIESMPEVKKAFKNITKAAVEEGVNFEGALVQQQIYGYDHRILCVGGKYAATLKRIPAYVVGNGVNTIEELIEVENAKEVRIDNARSPLAKIKLDEDMHDYLALQGLTSKSVPEEDKEIVLRRVANISAGGVSINVTKDIHQKNIEMVENIAKFLNVTALGIDVLAKDISLPWTEGNFGIIEINAGPGVFMHLAPAEGGAVDIPGKMMKHFFGDDAFKGSRIPIITGNGISEKLSQKIYGKLQEYKKDVEYTCVRKDGVYFNEIFFNNNPRHDINCMLALRNPKLDLAVINHDKNDIYDFGTWHDGCDIAILNKANTAEYTLERDLLPGGLLIEVIDTEVDDTITNNKPERRDDKREEITELISELKREILEIKKDLKKQTTKEENTTEKLIKNYQTELVVWKDGKELKRFKVDSRDDIEDVIFAVLEPHLKDVLFKYE